MLSQALTAEGPVNHLLNVSATQQRSVNNIFNNT